MYLIKVEGTEKRLPIGKQGQKQTVATYKCVCGTKKVINQNSVNRGLTKSCGCLNKIIAAKKAKTHGLSKTRTYKSWLQMKARCDNKNTTRYSSWGGRGVTYVERWKDFENFLKDMGERPPGMSLERINNDGAYSRQNCCWATDKQQANNRRNNVMLNYKGMNKTVAEWARYFDVSYATIYKRHKRGKDFYANLQGKKRLAAQ